jgi:CRP-like cAMP-binding protein
MSAPSDAELSKFSRLFAVLAPDVRQRLMAQAQKRQPAPGTVLCHQGDDGKEFFVIVRGTVAVTVDDLGEIKPIATLGAGQFFGELALLAGYKREATVTAQADLELIVFPLSALAEAVKTSPDAESVLKHLGLARAEDTMNKIMGA